MQLMEGKLDVLTASAASRSFLALAEKGMSDFTMSCTDTSVVRQDLDAKNKQNMRYCCALRKNIPVMISGQRTYFSASTGSRHLLNNPTSGFYCDTSAKEPGLLFSNETQDKVIAVSLHTTRTMSARSGYGSNCRNQQAQQRERCAAHIKE